MDMFERTASVSCTSVGVFRHSTLVATDLWTGTSSASQERHALNGVLPLIGTVMDKVLFTLVFCIGEVGRYWTNRAAITSPPNDLPMVGSVTGGELASRLRWRGALAVMLCACLQWLLASSASAAKPSCSSLNGTPYCQYVGPVSQAYVNANKDVLLFFDVPFGSAAEMTIPGVSNLSACVVVGAGNLDFAKMFYASALAAQAGGKTVTVQMWGSAIGYAACDRIWVSN